MAEDMTPAELLDKLEAMKKVTHSGVIAGLKQGILIGQRTAMEYCTPGAGGPFEDMLFPTKQDPSSGAPLDTGIMRASIYTFLMDTGSEVIGGVGCGQGGADGEGIGPGTLSGYPLFVHEGTSKMQSRPFLRMACEDQKDNILFACSRGVWNTIQEANL